MEEESPESERPKDDPGLDGSFLSLGLASAPVPLSSRLLFVLSRGEEAVGLEFSLLRAEAEGTRELEEDKEEESAADWPSLSVAHLIERGGDEGRSSLLEARAADLFSSGGGGGASSVFLLLAPKSPESAVKGFEKGDEEGDGAGAIVNKEVREVEPMKRLFDRSIDKVEVIMTAVFVKGVFDMDGDGDGEIMEPLPAASKVENTRGSSRSRSVLLPSLLVLEGVSVVVVLCV